MTCQETAKPQRSSLRIHLCARERSERAIFGVFNSFTVKKVNFFTINVNFKVILSSKSGGGGYLYRPSPHPKKWGIQGGGGRTMIFVFFFPLVSSAVVHGHDNTPTTKPRLRQSPPPPPPHTHTERLFQGCMCLVQNLGASAAVARHFGHFAPPPPSKQPHANLFKHSTTIMLKQCL